jgi:hypothetical protein
VLLLMPTAPPTPRRAPACCPPNAPQQVQPLAVHCTFQFGANTGKRNRLREAMLFADPPDYWMGGAAGLGRAPARPAAVSSLAALPCVCLRCRQRQHPPCALAASGVRCGRRRQLHQRGAAPRALGHVGGAQRAQRDRHEALPLPRPGHAAGGGTGDRGGAAQAEGAPWAWSRRDRDSGAGVASRHQHPHAPYWPLQVWPAIRLAAIANRSVIVPKLACYCDKYWTQLDKGRVPGAPPPSPPPPAAPRRRDTALRGSRGSTTSLQSLPHNPKATRCRSPCEPRLPCAASSPVPSGALQTRVPFLCPMDHVLDPIFMQDAASPFVVRRTGGHGAGCTPRSGQTRLRLEGRTAGCGACNSWGGPADGL